MNCRGGGVSHQFKLGDILTCETARFADEVVGNRYQVASECACVSGGEQRWLALKNLKTGQIADHLEVNFKLSERRQDFDFDKAELIKAAFGITDNELDAVTSQLKRNR